MAPFHSGTFMYLKELRINGFKSFANPTRLDLERGMTAIVGPNGCGKSNIADAIRWVLGEQSAKSLRAGAMQDVIFQGTDTRKPVNLCEVSLIFADCEAQLGTEYAEVEVTRRVLRDEGGQYFINGKQCRLRDIQRLFLDTGVGQVSYSFMLQGQIDQILSSNPAERRTIFEEAAGISRYKAQRREALNKLALVDANLARVTDVIEEVARQIGSLRRQAAKALRYKRIKHRLTHLDLAHSAFRFGNLRNTVSESERKASFLREEVDRLRAKLENEEQGLTGKRGRRSELSTELQEAQQTVFELRRAKENAESQAKFSKLRREENLSRIAEIEADLETMNERQSQLQERAAGESRSKEEQMSLFGDSDAIFREKTADLGKVQSMLAETETQLSREKQALLVKESAITRHRSSCTTLEVDLKSYQVRHSNILDEIRLLENQAELLTSELSEIKHASEQRKKAREVEEARVNERREQVASLTEAYRDVQGRISTDDRRLAEVIAQLRILEGLQSKLEGFSEGAKAVLQGKLPGVIDAADCDVLLKHVQVEPDYTRAFETLLGPLGEGVVVKDRRRIKAIASGLIEKKLGRAYLKFPVSQKTPGRSKSESVPDKLVLASSVVSCKSEELKPLVDALLEGCYFAESLDGFLEFWEQHPDFSFVQVVTPDGEIVDSRGWVLAGSTKKGNDRSYLARANEIKKFGVQKVELEKRLEEARQQAVQIQEKIDRAETAVEDQRRRLMEVSQEVTTLETQLRTTLKNQEQNAQATEQKRRELAGQESRKEESTQRLEKAKQALADSEADIEAQKGKIEQLELEVSRIREERERMRESFNDIRLEIAEKKQRLELLERGIAEITEQTREIQERRTRRRQERDSLVEQCGNLEAAEKAETGKATEVEKTLGATMTSLEKTRDALALVEKEISVVEEGIGKQREQYESISRELNQMDVALAKQQSQSGHLLDEIRREYDLDLKSVNWKVELWKAGDALPERIRVEIEEDSLDEPEAEERGDPTEEDLANLGEEIDWSEIDYEISQLRSRIQAIGAVNLVAIEEYKELNERYGFLKTQSEDLWKSKDELLSAIDEINTTSQELFANTFDQIRKNFSFTFDTLFGGGRADLQLVDAEDVLESGIEITAQPPGTRLKSLALLSGGQKTMTALALLFAVYMVKPSPFCVLDELDAPLDDANIGRFCKMLREFLQYSQFVVITHSKRTISVADTIYGVTMQEKGVSRLVSMRFDKSSGEAEELEAAS